MKKQVRENYELPVYEMTIDEDEGQGVQFISLVKNPAIEVEGKYFSKDDLKREAKYEFKSIVEKQIIVGPAMIPDKKILRKDEKGNPYYVYFSADTITKMCNKFNRENSNKDLNVDHGDTMAPGFIQANWQIESQSYDKSRYYGFENLPLKTWFIEVKIEDKKFWAKSIKEDGRFSFSIEGLMGEKPVKNSLIDLIDLIDKFTFNDLYAFLSIDDIPVHPNCQCDADENGWICMESACDECLAAQAEYNNNLQNGNFEMAMKIFMKHTGKK